MEIDRLNRDPRMHGILVQMPLPKHIDPNKVIERIDPRKDVDCFHPINVGRILIGEGEGFQPATPSGVQELLVRSGNDPAGKHVVICGRSNIVGKPLAAMLMQKRPGADATVTLCHSRTKDLASLTRQADILVSAMGIPRFIKADMVKEGAVVIDVGTSRVEDPTHPKGGRLVGDVDFEAVKGEGQGHHAGAQGRRADDHRHAHAQHRAGGGTVVVQVNSRSLERLEKKGRGEQDRPAQGLRFIVTFQGQSPVSSSSCSALDIDLKGTASILR